MLGLILCGGQSQRMGNDKGLMRLEEKSWAQSAADKMASINIPVKLSVNELQFPLYATQFSKNDLVTDNSSLTIKGPLLGALSCHLAFPAEDLFLLACDMPFMEASLLLSLYNISQEQPADTYVFSNDGEVEPLCGIYRSKGLASIVTMFKNGKLEKHSMKFMLDHLNVKKIPVKPGEKRFFSNINTHAELNGL